MRTWSIGVAIAAIGASITTTYFIQQENMRVKELRLLNSAVNLSDKRAVVVGGTAGIGKSIALRLAQANASVTVLGRNKKRGAELVEEMKAIAPSSETEFEFLPCDVSLLSNVKTCSQDILKTKPELDYLVFTQGIATLQGRTETSEGIDVKMTLHYYSRMLFINLFGPQLDARQGKVLDVFSGGVHSPYKDYKEDVELTHKYSQTNAANAAGFYQDVALGSLAKKFSHVSMIHIAPGFVSTTWGTELPWILIPIVRVLQRTLAKSSADCAEYMCVPLFDNDLKPGFYVKDQYAQEALPSEGVDEAREIVMRHTNQVLEPYM